MLTIRKNEFNRENVQNILAYNLLQLMEEKQVSIPELATYCDVTIANIKQLLKGEQFLSARVLSLICNKLEVKPSDLFACDYE